MALAYEAAPADEGGNLGCICHKNVGAVCAAGLRAVWFSGSVGYWEVDVGVYDGIGVRVCNLLSGREQSVLHIGHDSS